MKYISTRGDAPAAAVLRDPARGAGARRRPVPARALPPGHAAELARWRELSYPELAFEVLSLYIDDIPPDDLRALVDATYTAEVFGNAPRSRRWRRWRRAATSSGSRTARRSRSRTWRCSCSATCSSTCWRAAARRSTSSVRPPATPVRAAEYAMRGKRGVRVFMLSPHGQDEPVPAGADVLAAGSEHLQHRRSAASSTTARTSSRRSPTTLLQGGATASARSTRSTGRACWPRSSTTSSATCAAPTRVRATSEVALRGAVRQLRQHLRRPRRAHDGPADRPPGARDQREQRARRVLPHRRLPGARAPSETHETSQPVDGHLARPPTSSASSSTCVGRDPQRARDAVRGRSSARSGAFTLTAAEFARFGRFGFVSGTSTHADRLATIPTRTDASAG